MTAPPVMQPSGETIRDLLNRAEAHLVRHGVPNARRNAEWMMCHALQCSTLELYTASIARPPADRTDAFWSIVERRAAREPLQYILGITEFMSLPFEVRAGVFVPRPDTEVLVERAERHLRRRPLHEPLTALDLCCGCGVVAVSLARRIPNLTVVAVDVSLEAVELTQWNARRNSVSDRVHAVASDAAAFLARTARPVEHFGAVLCNPPYIETGQLAALPREVREHEPLSALDGGEDGLDMYRHLVPSLSSRLSPSGFAAFEIGDTQAAAVSGMLRDAGFRKVEVFPDYAARDRVVLAHAR